MDDNDKNEKKTNDTKKEKELSFSNISRIFGSFLLISEIEQKKKKKQNIIRNDF